MRLAVVVLALVACTPRITPAPPAHQPAPPFTVARETPVSTELRLPRPLVPTGYRAHLSLAGERIDGSLAITGELAAPTDTLWVHAEELVIQRARAVSGGRTVLLEPRAIVGHARIALLAERPLPAGRWTIELTYSARITDHGAIDPTRWGGDKVVDGVFRQQLGGRSYVATMFEPLAARRAFPCIDEPDVKVPWQLTLDVDAKDIAASNSAIVREMPLPGDRKRVEFAPTQPLPSYLIAFAVGPFDVIDLASAKSGVPVRILCLAGQTARASWVRAHTTELLDAAEVWTGIPYPYRKLDIVVVPRGGNHWTAMEHPGLITAASTLLDRSQDDESGGWWRGVLAHEIAHQWFGNLVTHAWWDDIWLNEGFAVWLGDKLVRALAPQPMLFDHILRHNYAAQAKIDDHALRIRAPLADTQRAKDIFRYMNGGRGAQLISMLEAFLGPDAFQQALRAYLTAHAHGNATTADLVATVTKDAALATAIASFVDNDAAPEIAVERACSATQNVARLRLNGAWSVPVCLAYDRNGARAERCLIVDQPITEVALDACPTWLHPNARGAGYYTTIWAPADLDALLVRGWPQLTRSERYATIASAERSTDSVPGVSAAMKLYDRGESDLELREWVARTLAMHAHQVPDDLRAAFAAKLGKRLTPSVRAATTLPTEPLALAALAAEAELVAMAGDPTASKHLLAATVNPHLARARLVIAARLDPTVATRQLTDLMSNAADGWSLIYSLAYHPAIVAIVGAAKVTNVRVYAQLFARQCSNAARAAAHAVIDGNVVERDRANTRKWVDESIDECMAERTQLDPIFRGWLAPTPSSRSRRAR